METGAESWDRTTRHVLLLMSVSGVGPSRLMDLSRKFGDVEAAWNAPLEQLLEVMTPAAARGLVRARRHPPDVDAMLKRAQIIGARIVTLCHDAYPSRLRSIYGPPAVLYVCGDLTLLSSPAVAVVGTRNASGYGRMAAREIATELSQSGFTIVSGMARGIDGIAHQAALRLGCPTVAVLGSGIDVPYPPEHRGLMARIVETGAVVSEFPPGTQPEPFHFPRRNRIVSGLTDATVVIEAGRKSGALITAKLALEQGRDVFAVPGRLTDQRAAGTNHLLANGAGFARSARDVLDGLSVPGLWKSRATRPEPEDATQAALLESLALEPLQIDELIRETGLGGADVIRALSVMEMKGWVQNMGNMVWMAVQ